VKKAAHRNGCVLSGMTPALKKFNVFFCARVYDLWYADNFLYYRYARDYAVCSNDNGLKKARVMVMFFR
jgi:hypothetical protein